MPDNSSGIRLWARVAPTLLLCACQTTAAEPPPRPVRKGTVGVAPSRVVPAKMPRVSAAVALTTAGSGGSGARSTGLMDRGVFSQFDSKISLRVPAHIGRTGNAIYIDKKRRVLVLLHKGAAVKAYPVRFGFAPGGDKVRQGDGRTPEGRYYICEALHRNLARRYGARSLRISYPNAADGRRGLAQKLINPGQLRRIERAVSRRRTPPQNTRLGSSIRIHGGGISGNWTLGCIAMRDADVIELYRHVGLSTPVVIRAKSTGLPDRDRDAIPDAVDVLMGAKKLVHNRARYKGSYVRLRYPMGDVSPKIGVCTDVIVRALRNAGFDLQQLMHRHIKAHRRLYRWIKRPDRNIDHRRVRDMLVYFRHHFRLLARSVKRTSRRTLMPGDVVFMDTLPKHGPDHVGIISDRLGKSGFPLVINNWTNGYHTSEMDLLATIPVTHHFRLLPKKKPRPARP